MTKKIIRSGLILACGVLMSAAYMTATDQPATVASSVQQPIVAVLRFAVQLQQITDSAALSSQACTEPSAVPDLFTVDPKLLDKISSELQRKLSKKTTVMVDPDPKSIPVGSLVISGCIFQAQTGNKAKKMVGMGLGASRLGANVIIFYKTQTGFNLMDAFEVQVKGRFLSPPAPAAVVMNAGAQTKTLYADAEKLAGRIVKKLEKNS